MARCLALEKKSSILGQFSKKSHFWGKRHACRLPSRLEKKMTEKLTKRADTAGWRPGKFISDACYLCCLERRRRRRRWTRQDRPPFPLPPPSSSHFFLHFSTHATPCCVPSTSLNLIERRWSTTGTINLNCSFGNVLCEPHFDGGKNHAMPNACLIAMMKMLVTPVSFPPNFSFPRIAFQPTIDMLHEEGGGGEGMLSYWCWVWMQHLLVFVVGLRDAASVPTTRPPPSSPSHLSGCERGWYNL